MKESLIGKKFNRLTIMAETSKTFPCGVTQKYALCVCTGGPEEQQNLSQQLKKYDFQ